MSPNWTWPALSKSDVIEPERAAAIQQALDLFAATSPDDEDDIRALIRREARRTASPPSLEDVQASVTIERAKPAEPAKPAEMSEAQRAETAAMIKRAAAIRDGKVTELPVDETARMILAAGRARRSENDPERPI
jgi:hypothetical protein